LAGVEKGKQQILNEDNIRLDIQYKKLSIEMLSIKQEDDAIILKSIIKGDYV
jgi:hypothetical protein